MWQNVKLVNMSKSFMSSLYLFSNFSKFDIISK